MPYTYGHMCRDDHIQIGHAYSGDDERCPLCQAISALQSIRDEAATKSNGGAWAAGIATLCLATLPQDVEASRVAPDRSQADASEVAR